MHKRAVKMKTCIALFRGINVGGGNGMRTKELAVIPEYLGACEVRTYPQSGNAVFGCLTGTAQSSPIK